MRDGRICAACTCPRDCFDCQPRTFIGSQPAALAAHVCCPGSAVVIIIVVVVIIIAVIAACVMASVKAECRRIDKAVPGWAELIHMDGRHSRLSILHSNPIHAPFCRQAVNKNAGGLRSAVHPSGGTVGPLNAPGHWDYFISHVSAPPVAALHAPRSILPSHAQGASAAVYLAPMAGGRTLPTVLCLSRARSLFCRPDATRRRT